MSKPSKNLFPPTHPRVLPSPKNGLPYLFPNISFPKAIPLSRQIEKDLEAESLIKQTHIEETRKKIDRGEGKTDEDFSKKTQKIQNLDYHKTELESFFKKVGSSQEMAKNGLTTAEAEERLKTNGLNMLSERAKTPW